MTLSPDQQYMVDKIAERAFPGSGIAVVQPGMTLRDFFAAAALQGLLADNCNKGPWATFAQGAYRIADAMLKEREK